MAAAVVIVFAVVISVFSIRNNDIWWLMAVARRIFETKAFVYQDPFTFTALGAPWSPQAWLSGIVFYLTHGLAGAGGLIVLRIVLVAGIVVVALRTLKHVGVSWALASPVFIVVLLTCYNRFIVRAHLFEYLFIALILWFLLSNPLKRGRSFFVIPVAIQLLWVNMHPSYFLGVVLVGLFFLGEWISVSLAPNASFIRPIYREKYDWKRIGILLGLMVVACFINPNPPAFLMQPLGGEQRELLSRYTLEWRSPFDPQLATASFHPYYEIMLALGALAVLLALTRLPVAGLLLLLATSGLSLQSHRFRVEYALVALTIVPLLISRCAALEMVRGLLPVKVTPRRMIQFGIPLVVTLFLIIVGRGAVDVSFGVDNRYPSKALDFVRENDVGKRPFNTIGFGSYMTWHLYGERGTFIDGRNFKPELYQDFIDCQSNIVGFDRVIDKHQLDAFILPSLEKSDEGMRNLHQAFTDFPGWKLSHLDPIAYVYVKETSTTTEWWVNKAMHEYHPLTLPLRAFDQMQLEQAIAEIQRAIENSPSYIRPRLDLALVYTTVRSFDRAIAVLIEAKDLEPNNERVWSRLAQTFQRADRHIEAIQAYMRLKELRPREAYVWYNLGKAYEGAGNEWSAINSYQTALEVNPAYRDAFVALLEVHGRKRNWDSVLKLSDRLIQSSPQECRGYYWRSLGNAGLNRGAVALGDAERALELCRQDVEVLVLLGNLYMAKGDIAAAARKCDEALSIDPENAAAQRFNERLKEVRP